MISKDLGAHDVNPRQNEFHDVRASRPMPVNAVALEEDVTESVRCDVLADRDREPRRPCFLANW